MSSQAYSLEEEAQDFLSREKFEDAFRAFRKAANIYRSEGRHKEASLCFASAASCWSIKSGEKTFYNAASSYEEAAKEAERVGDYEYACLLYKYAATNYERDGEFTNFSECFYHSKDARRRFLFLSLFAPSRLCSLKGPSKKAFPQSFLKRLFMWLFLEFSFIIWGYGERPSHTFLSAVFIIFVCAVLYMKGPLYKGGFMFVPNFAESLYFSVTNFTNLGYGDVTPAGISKLIVCLESVSGIFVVPLFVIGLSRKYLRI